MHFCNSWCGVTVEGLATNIPSQSQSETVGWKLEASEAGNERGCVSGDVVITLFAINSLWTKTQARNLSVQLIFCICMERLDRMFQITDSRILKWYYFVMPWGCGKAVTTLSAAAGLLLSNLLQPQLHLCSVAEIISVFFCFVLFAVRTCSAWLPSLASPDLQIVRQQERLPLLSELYPYIWKDTERGHLQNYCKCK